MGCASSTEANNNKAEADRYARRKKNNFRDSGLERHRKACVQQKKQLRHVEPNSNKAKRHPAAKHTKQTKTYRPSGPKQQQHTAGPLFKNEGELKQARKNLKHRR